MTKFVYNNTKNVDTGHMPFKLNYYYYLQMSYRKKVNPHSKSKLVDKLSAELRELIIVCQKNLYHIQELQKRAQDKGVKLKKLVIKSDHMTK